MASLEQELRTAMKTGKLELGTKTTLKHLKFGKVKVVVIAANIDPNIREDIKRYASLSKTPVLTFQGTSLELGSLLGKPFPVQALAVIDQGESHILELVEEMIEAES